MSNLTCFKHPGYKGDSAPDLSCKVCCAKFVGRIRAEQNAKFEALKDKMQNSFTPLREVKPQMQVNAEPKPAKFDSSWV